MIRLPNGRLKPLAASVTDGNVRKEVVVIIANQRIGKEDPERVVRNRAKDVVAEGAATTVGSPRGIVKERSEVSETALWNALVRMERK